MGTTKQVEARERNWYIVRLRALHIQVGLLRNPESVKAMREEIDKELVSLGAESQSARCGRVRLMVTEGRWEDLDVFKKKHGFKGFKSSSQFPF